MPRTANMSMHAVLYSQSICLLHESDAMVAPLHAVYISREEEQQVSCLKIRLPLAVAFPRYSRSAAILPHAIHYRFFAVVHTFLNYSFSSQLTSSSQNFTYSENFVTAKIYREHFIAPKLLCSTVGGINMERIETACCMRGYHRYFGVCS